MCVRCQGSIIITLEQQLQLQKKASAVEAAAKLHEELREAQSQLVEMREQMEAVRAQLLASQAEAQSHLLDGRGQLVESEAEVARLESGFDALALRLSEASTELTRERQLRLEHEAAWPAAAREQMAAEVEAARAEATAAREEAAAAREEAAAARGQMQVMAEVEAAMATAAAAAETAREQMVAEVEAARAEAAAEAAAAREETAVAAAAAAAAAAEMQAAEVEAKAARETAATAAAVVDQATRKMQAAQAEAGAARQGRGAVVAIKVPPEAAAAAAAAAETEGVQAGVRAELARVRVELVAGAEAARAETAAARAEVAAVQAQMAVAVAALHTHLHGGPGSQERGAWSRRASPPSRPKWKPPGASPERPAQVMRAPLQPHLRVHSSPRRTAPSCTESRSAPRLERPTHWTASPPHTPRAGKATNAAAWRAEDAEDAAQSQPGPVARGLMAEGFMGWTGAGPGHSGQWRLDVAPPAAVASRSREPAWSPAAACGQSLVGAGLAAVSPGVQPGDDLALARAQLAETRAQMHQILSYLPGCFPLSGSEPGV